MHPIRISYHGLPASDALTALIHARAGQLAQLSDRIHSVRVVVDAPHHHHRHGNHYCVRIDVRLPGRDIVVGNEPADADEDAYQAVRHAFDAARRRLTAAQTRRSGKQRGHFDIHPSIRAAR
jgi:ribosome-associated translation inhibitor RaiA